MTIKRDITPWTKEQCESKIAETRARIAEYNQEMHSIDKQLNFLNDRRAALRRRVSSAQEYLNVVKTQMDDIDAPKWAEI